ncbi:MAG TPA: 16S rRNA (guanine(527)-N(7))-methyltransferase RsmG [Oscillospiraceae bacterium]|nr:16S rRNA (guanine(527)-N(7))-methyltransferase RsmG [Oscillospiraceae bacterium]HPK34838.1 16S rRNA (guanine(527)-N(7))-methyltransferase RsmG [Oscillospiraceae bacterium]HPR76853.1 16S rRNA (guanine(527)-N(7))-methyltransferase RsmG [Oscillospiraceae bacterium]
MIEKYCAEHSIEYTPQIDEKLHHYADFLIDYNQKVNLTAIKTPEDIEVKHFIDSITLLLATEVKGNVLDIGSGAGFPGVVLKLFRPDIELSLMDSNGKKAKFLELLCQEMEIKGNIILGRAEDLGNKQEYREKYDLVCARAVAECNVLCEYCMPFVKTGGTFAAMKGSNWQEELNGAQNAIKILGGKIKETKEFALPDGSRRGIILLEKISRTPTNYPRIGAKISKKPL